MSGGLSETLTDRKAIMAATRSIEEWIVSDIILTDPLIIPTNNFNKIRKVFDIIERRAILTLAFIIMSDFGLSISDF